MGRPVVHFEVGATDLKAASGFYSELFEWDVSMGEGGYGLVDTDAGEGIRGGILQTPEGVPTYVTFYVGVDDLEKYLTRAEELGGSRIMDPMVVGEVGSFAMLADPDGNAIGLFMEKTAT